MKHVSFVIASACCLAIAAAPASASDSAKIAQGGSGNTVMIEQVATGGNNQAAVRQGENWYGSGSGNHAFLMQHGVDNSQIDVVQSGFNNQYMVHQMEGTNLQANVNVHSGQYGDGGEGNLVDIRQSGANAHAWVEQAGSMSSRAEIWQSGWGGYTHADVHQSGHNNQARVEQMGGDNQASIQQYGSNLNASIIQSSHGYYGAHGNNATIRQGF